MNNRPYTAETLAERWGCSAEKIRQMFHRNELVGFRLGKLIRIPAAEVEKFECASANPVNSTNLYPTAEKSPWQLDAGKIVAESSTGTNDPGLARIMAHQIWQKVHAPASERMRDLWSLYLSDRIKDGRDVTRQHNAWKRLEPSFGDRFGTDINKDDCREYALLRQRQGGSSGTAKTELEYLRACLNLRYGRGLNRVWIPAASRPRDRYLTKEELDCLLDNVGTAHVRLFIILAVTTGARMSAILDLSWDQVDFKHHTIDFNQPGREQSNKRRPIVPLNSRAKGALDDAVRGALTDHVIEWDGKPVRSIKKAIRMAAQRSAIPCSPHVFRHTAGVWMAQADVPLQKIAQFLGHTSTRVTERTYARYSPSFMKDAAAALDW